MRMVIFGAGMMGRAAAYDLVRNHEVESVKILEKDIQTLLHVQQWLNSPKVSIETLNAQDEDAVRKALRDYDCALSCIPYKFNYTLAKAAIAAGCNFLDLGGNNDVVQQELSLHYAAKEQNVLIVPDCGLAPGLSSVLTKTLVEELDSVDAIQLRVGGLPQYPKTSLNYALVFSVEGLVNEYIEPCLVLREGKIVTIPPMEELENLEFPGYGTLEAFTTSGGLSTLPYTFEGEIAALDYKTIRYPGHCQAFKELQQNAENRETLEEMLLKMLPKGKEDIVLLRATGKGTKDGRVCTIAYEMIDHYDPSSDLTAMMRTTTFPATILLDMIGSGKIDLKGAYTQEHFVPAQEIVNGLTKRGVTITRKELFPIPYYV